MISTCQTVPTVADFPTLRLSPLPLYICIFCQIFLQFEVLTKSFFCTPLEMHLQHFSDANQILLTLGRIVNQSVGQAVRQSFCQSCKCGDVYQSRDLGRSIPLSHSYLSSCFHTQLFGYLLGNLQACRKFLKILFCIFHTDIMHTSVCMQLYMV